MPRGESFVTSHFEPGHLRHRIARGVFGQRHDRYDAGHRNLRPDCRSIWQCKLPACNSGDEQRSAPDRRGDTQRTDTDAFRNGTRRADPAGDRGARHGAQAARQLSPKKKTQLPPPQKWGRLFMSASDNVTAITTRCDKANILQIRIRITSTKWIVDYLLFHCLPTAQHPGSRQRSMITNADQGACATRGVIHVEGENVTARRCAYFGI